VLARVCSCELLRTDDPGGPRDGEPVDKASVVIVKDAIGKVLYFTSEETLRRYRG
jgi:hypothetical protein